VTLALAILKGMRMNVTLVYFNKSPNVGWGAGYVCASIIGAGHKLRFYDTLYSSAKEIAASITEWKCDVFMVSTMTMLFPEALQLIRMVKAKVSVTALVGGIYATIMGKVLLEMHEEIDYLCVGEGQLRLNHIGH
jgi:radical SAM superfamily enzyme YgiQ (UPF0313 family)